MNKQLHFTKQRFNSILYLNNPKELVNSYKNEKTVKYSPDKEWGYVPSASRQKLTYYPAPTCTMLGSKSFELIKDLDRNPLTIPAFNDELVRQVLVEIQDIYAANSRDA